MVKEAIDAYMQGELWPKAKRCAAEMEPRYFFIISYHYLLLKRSNSFQNFVTKFQNQKFRLNFDSDVSVK